MVESGSTLPTAEQKELCCKFIDRIRSLVDDNRLDDVVDVLTDEQNLQVLKNSSWEIIPIITEPLDAIDDFSSNIRHSCSACLQQIAQRGNVEETLLELLSEADTKNDAKFIAVLQPLTTVLLRMEKKAGKSMEWTFKTVQGHMKTVPVEEICGDDINVENARQTIQRIGSLYQEVVYFFKPLVSKVVHSEDSTMIQRKALISFILHLLDKPFIYLDETAIDNMKSVIEDMVESLCTLTIDPMLIIDYHLEEDFLHISRISNSPIEDLCGYLTKNEVSVQSVAVFFYLMIYKQIQMERIPCVYHHTFIFHCGLHLACFLLKSEVDTVRLKGLYLIKSVLEKLSDADLTSNVLDLPEHYEFAKYLINIMVYCTIKTSRILAIDLFKRYLFKFDLKGQYLLLFNLHKSVDHSSSNLRGFLMTQLKEIINRTTSQKIKSGYFTGKLLCDLVALYCNVTPTPETYLLEIHDEVISALNLIRFLILRDKENMTGIWSYLTSLNENFFMNLEGSLKYSREFCKKLDVAASDCQDPLEKFSVAVGNEVLSMTPDDNAALVVYDLIESVMKRVKECLNEGINDNNES